MTDSSETFECTGCKRKVAYEDLAYDVMSDLDYCPHCSRPLEEDA